MSSVVDIPSETRQATATSDREMVARALSSGLDGFGPIIERYKDAVFGVALARLRNFHDAEDLTQATFLEAFDGLSRLRDPDRLGAWLRTIAIHRCINYLKRRQRVVDFDSIAEPVSSTPSPHADLEHAELREQVLRSVNRLRKTQRETLTLFYISEYSLAEVAAIQEVPVGTVKRRLHEARKLLKEDMLEMVEEVLKDNVPDEALADRVFEALVAYPPGRRLDNRATKEVVARLGRAGKKGFERSLELPQWLSRMRAVRYVGRYYGQNYGDDGPPLDFALDLLIRGLGDANRRVRQVAAGRLIFAQRSMSHEDWARDVLPHMLALVTHPSVHTRRMALGALSNWARYLGTPKAVVRQALPLAVICRAMVRETVPGVLRRFQRLIEHILEAHEDD